jgi:putative methyltransferase (TIGR04325 family)
LRKPEWEYIPEGWTYIQAHPEVKGWNVQDVLETYKRKWPKFAAMIHGTEPLGITHESDITNNTDIYSHNTIMAFAYALALAAHKKDRLSILDWGGGIGHYYLLSQALLPGVDIEYHCKDAPLLCEYGTQLFPEQYFYTDECCFKRTYDFVMASTSIHYTEEWRVLLRNLADATDKYLYIAQLPIVRQSPSFVFVQRPYQYGYNTEYLSWCLNRTEFLTTAEGSGLELVREFVYGYHPFIDGAPEQNMYRGYLFWHIKKGKCDQGKL